MGEPASLTVRGRGNGGFVLAFDEPAAFTVGRDGIAEVFERDRQRECRVEIGAGHIGGEFGVAFRVRPPAEVQAGDRQLVAHDRQVSRPMMGLACGTIFPSMNAAELQDFARRYTEASCSHDPDSVASFFAEDGSLAVNGQTPAVGRPAIADVARGFYDAFPDTVVILDLARLAGDRAVDMWTYEGTNTGPGGTGHRVRFNGWEQWTLDSNGLISISDGRFDTADYERQRAHGM